MKKSTLVLLVILLSSFTLFAQTGPQGKYLTLNGTDQHMTIADHADFDIIAGESYTLTCRIRQANFSAQYRIFAKGNLNVAGGRYELFTNNTASAANIALNLRNADNTNIGTPYVATLQAARWTHFAWVYNAADHTSKVYIDGTLMNTITNAAIGTKTVENANDLLVGCGLQNAASPSKFMFWPGDMDELRIWKRALTEAEVTVDRSAAAAAAANLVGAYDFENVNGDLVPDVSGKGHTGTLKGYGIRVVKSALPAGAGNTDERLVAFRLVAENRTSTLKSISFNLNGTTDLADLVSVKAYYNGSQERFIPENATLFGTAVPSAGTLVIQGEAPLVDGENYIWITADLRENAKEGNQIGGQVVSCTLGDGTVKQIGELEGTRTILLASTLLYQGGDGGSKSYRIPAIVTALDGSLVTATDKRWDNSGDLPNHIDVVIRRSTDKGKTWSDALTIAGVGTNKGYGDPALVVNRKTGEIVCLFASDKGWTSSTAADPQRINQSVSTDNGVTWSEPVDITSQIYGAACSNPITKVWPGAFVTSGAATQLRSGRLMAVLAARETAANVISNFVIYSDDNAKTWKASTNRASLNGDEAKVVELDNGDVLMSIRHSGHRWFNISHDQGITWGSTFDQNQITDPFCNGDLIRYTALSDGYEKNRLLHSIPFASSRKNVSVLLSYDEGENWPVRKTIYSGSSAYSALTILSDGTIGMYYEVGEYETYQMYFVRFSLDWLSDGNDTYVGLNSSADLNVTEPADFRIYPNPASDTLTIRGSIGMNTDIRVFSISGQLLETQHVSSQVDELSLSVRGFEPGSYFVQIGPKALRFEVNQ